jgi:hypothetical protein
MVKRLLAACGLLVLGAFGFLAVPSASSRPCWVKHHNCPTTSTTTTTTPTTTTVPTTTTTGGGGTVEWRGDFETADLSQWWLHQWNGGTGCGGPCTPAQVGNTTGTVVTSPVAQGTYALEVTASSCTSGCPNDRAEVLATQQDSGGYPNQEWYYGWYTRFKSGAVFWPNGDGWNDFVQFFSTGGSAWIYLGIGANNGTPKIVSNGPWGNLPVINPLVEDHWYHFVVHAIWSTDPNVGLWELWADGVKIQSLHTATLQNATVPENSNYTVPGMVLSQGFYGGANPDDVTAYADGMCRATTYQAAASC